MTESTMRPALRLLLCLILVVVCHAVACNYVFTDGNEATIAGKVEKGEAAFQTGMISISPSIPMVGDTLILSAVVKNTGDIAGTYTAILTHNQREVDQKQVEVAPVSSSTVTFQVGNLAAGYHQVGIGGSQTDITVYEWKPYTISYCKGQSDWTAFAGDPETLHGNEDAGQIVHFIVPAKPFKIKQIWINGEVMAENLQELGTRQFTVTIWNLDRSEQLWSEEFPWCLFDNRMSWRAVNVPDVRVEDDFYVEVVTGSDTGNRAKNYLTIAFEIARDALPEPRSLEYYRKSASDSHSGWSLNGQPIEPPGRGLNLNWCIRVDGFGKG